ncbi:DUF1349 domain-containing protein [Paenibacillus nanensis]|uniref:DUF1349 domain-containing protein n=1 Tax=Paenibacillus nanensis TaxID=393251 RepID=A0A3A1USL8_9BACL|nr:sugar-binding domain-containing protein [Paenibacillus nanensis]RIX50796.1 DUF1349 domain-containing protein [Paenibacillus nanensis]
MIIGRTKAISAVTALAVLFSLIAAAFANAPRAYASEAAASEEAPLYQGLKAEYFAVGNPPGYAFGDAKGVGLAKSLDINNLEPTFKFITGLENRVGVRLTGYIVPEFTEDYTFSIIGDNGFRLWIDDTLVIDHWIGDWDKEQIGAPVALTAGHKHAIKLELFEDNGGSNVHLRWESASITKEAVPASAFYMPEGFQPGGVIAQDGLTAEIHFEAPLKPESVTGELLSHMSLRIPTGNLQAASAELKDGDAQTVVIKFQNPVYGKDMDTVKVVYDGAGGLETQAGEAVAAFDKPVLNLSAYQIMTPWADDVDPANVLPEYPRPQLARDAWLNLNGEWEFQAARVGEALPAGQTLKEKILVPFAAEAKLSGINRVEDLMWYKREFTVPSEWDGQRVKLNFGAVDYLATVYVNGQNVGSHKGGYTSFSFDITDYLVEGENELIVHVLDKSDMGEDQAVGKQTVKKLGGIWYTSVSGIWQTVWLEPVAAAHIEKLDMATDIQEEVLKLTAPAAGAQAGGYTVEAVVSAGGETIGSATGEPGKEIRVAIPDARLWSPDDPFLYDLKVYLKNGDTVVDEVTSYFGMREIKLGKVDGITRPMLNGEFVFQMGPLDQGFWPDGIYTAPTDEALRFDIEAVKRVGMNTIRKHIKVEPARWYYWADKLGVLVWQDMPSLEDRQYNRGSDISDAAKAQWLKEYKEMVDQLRSVTSIIVWTVFNEGWGQFDQGGAKTREATAYVESLDSTRLVNSTSGWWDAGAGDLIDMHSYPAPNSPAPSDTRAAVLGEYGGLGLHVPGHEWSPLVFSYQLMNSKEQLTSQYINYIDRVKEMKANGLSAAIYTQITDVEYEINGLLSYDRKVEKIDFARIAKAHRELIGGVTKEDLLEELAAAEALADGAVTGGGAGQYAQAVMEAFREAIEAAAAVADNGNATKDQIQGAITSLKSAREQFFVSVNDPIPAGSSVDGFDEEQLDPAWTVYKPNNSKWSLTRKPGFLSLETSGGDIYQELNSLPNIFLQDAPEGDFAITFKVTAPVRRNYQQAGLILWQNEDNFFRLGHVWDTTGSTGKSLETAYEKNRVYRKASNMAPHPGYDTSYLQIRKVGNVASTYYWDGTAWKAAADPMTIDLSDLKIGFYGMSTGDNVHIQADFDYFSVGPVAPEQPQEPSVMLSGPSQTATGESFDVMVGSSDIADERFETMFAQILTVNFDSSKLALSSAASVKEGFGVLEQKVLEPGKVRIVAAGQGSGIDANAEWLKLSFMTLEAEEASSTVIRVSDAEAANGSGEELQLRDAEHAVNIRAQADVSALLEAIASAEAIYNAAVVGTLPGQYPAAAKTAFGAAIAEAKATAADGDVTGAEVTAAINKLNAAVAAFQASVLSGDINNDSRITVGDLGILAAAYGKSSSDPDWARYSKADLNRDGKVDIEDIAMMARWILI